MRVAHYLKSNKGCEAPHECIWVDTETHQRRVRGTRVSHHLTFGWACYQRTTPKSGWTDPVWCRFTTRRAFWDWVDGRVRERTRLFLFAHNWSFDGPVLDIFRELPKRGWTLQRAVIEGPPLILRYRRDSSTICVLDTLNWWRTSLSTLGESIGLAKLTMPSRRAGGEAWDAYCRRDVEVIRQALHRWWTFLKTHDLGGFAPTLAGQSMRSYRHRFMTEKILIDDDGDALDLARRAYHGGRVECFRLGRVAGPISILDVNSMYPYVMAEHQYPAALETVASRVTLRELRSLLRRYCVVADVALETDEPAYAHVVGGRLCFPVGRFREALTTPDLAYALEHKHIRQVGTVAIYKPARLFRSFVDELYAQRLLASERGDEVSKHLFKILLNSLYGKWGQRAGKWTEYARSDTMEARAWDEVDADTGKVYHYRQCGGLIQYREDEGESRESHPAIAAHITAYARRYLWDLIYRAGREHVVYCDTDCIWCDRAGAKHLNVSQHPSRLGALKLEADHPYVTLYGPKDYRTGRRWKIKGVRQSAEILAQGVYRQDRWSSLRGLLRRGDLSAPTTEKVVKHLRRNYLKGTPCDDGHVLPLSLSEW